MLIICGTCGAKKHVSECRGHLKHCSRSCYEASLLLDADEVQRMARQGYSRRQAAAALEMPYPTFYRKLKKQSLNHFFLGRGYYQVLNGCSQ